MATAVAATQPAPVGTEGTIVQADRIEGARGRRQSTAGQVGPRPGRRGDLGDDHPYPPWCAQAVSFGGNEAFSGPSGITITAAHQQQYWYLQSGQPWWLERYASGHNRSAG